MPFGYGTVTIERYPATGQNAVHLQPPSRSVVTSAKRRFDRPFIDSRPPEVDWERSRCGLELLVGIPMLGSAELTDEHDIVRLRNIAEPFEDSIVESDPEKLCRNAEAPEEVRERGENHVESAEPRSIRNFGGDLSRE
jgi:hypothetical protein